MRRSKVKQDTPSLWTGNTMKGCWHTSTVFICSAFSLRGLYKLLHQCLLDVRRVKPDKPVCLVLDDLSVLVSVGVRLVEVVGLVHYCQHMVTSTAHTVSHYIYLSTLHYSLINITSLLGKVRASLHWPCSWRLYFWVLSLKCLSWPFYATL